MKYDLPDPLEGKDRTEEYRQLRPPSLRHPEQFLDAGCSDDLDTPSPRQAPGPVGDEYKENE
jgi:hypothetical protein